MFNTADVSVSTKEAQRRKATLSQSPAMQSTLPATVSFVQPALFLPVAPFKMPILYTTHMFHIVSYCTNINIHPILVRKSTFLVFSSFSDEKVSLLK